MQLYFSYNKSTTTVKSFYKIFAHCFHVWTKKKSKLF